MAGSLTSSSIHEPSPEYSQWLIGYARFVPYPSSHSPYPGLTPLGKRELNPSPFGTWLSTSSSKVFLQMVNEVNRSDVILSAKLRGKLLEEHYISKLNFSWPQMSCVSGFQPRGSRVILVSYKDSANKIQKFALRFSTCDAALTFVAVLKEKFKRLEEGETMFESSLQTDYITPNQILPRATEKEPSMVTLLNSYIPETLPRLEYQAVYQPQSVTVEEQTVVNKHIDSYVHEMLPKIEYHNEETLYIPQPALSQEYSIHLPPSFTALLSGCFSKSTLGRTTAKQDPELKSDILKYMEESSFQDMLQKVERIMDEIGCNWIV